MKKILILALVVLIAFLSACKPADGPDDGAAAPTSVESDSHRAEKKELPGTKIKTIKDYQWLLDSVWEEEKRDFEPRLFYTFDEFSAFVQQCAKENTANQQRAKERSDKLLEDLNAEYFKENMAVVLHTKPAVEGNVVYFEGASVDGNELCLAFNESPNMTGVRAVKLIKISKKYMKESMTVRII